MRPTHNSRKRPLEQDSSTANQTSKRFCPSTRESEAAFAIAGLSNPQYRDISPAAQEGLRAINASLRTGHACLDLSHLSADQLEHLPPELVDPAIRSIQTLILPAGLRRLPAFCKQLHAVTRLEIPDFLGDALDLRHLTTLRQLSGSAGKIFSLLHLNQMADIYFRVQERVIKIHVCRYDETGVMRNTHALPSHAYYKTLDGEQIPSEHNLNSVSFFYGTQNAISCDAIAPEMLYRRLSPKAAEWKRTGYFGITDAKSLTNTISEQSRTHYNNMLSHSEYYAFVDNAKFSQWLEARFEVMLTRPTDGSVQTLPDGRLVCGLRAFSSNHELYFLMIVKPGQPEEFAAELYDPNLTKTHKRMTARYLNEINHPQNPWLLSDFLNTRMSFYYMRGSNSPALWFAGTTQRKSAENFQVELWVDEAGLSNPDIMFLLTEIDAIAQAENYWQRILLQYKQKNISLLQLFYILDCHNINEKHQRFVMMDESIRFNYEAIINKFVIFIEQFAELLSAASPSELSMLPPECLRLLLQPSNAWSTLVRVIDPSKKNAFREYLKLANRLLDKGQISAAEILELISAKNAQGENSITAAIKSDDPETLSLLCKMIRTLVARGQLDATQALGLIDPAALASGTEAQRPVIWDACGSGSDKLLMELRALLTDLGQKFLAPKDLSQLPDADLMDMSMEAMEPVFEPAAQRNLDYELRVLIHRLIFGATKADAVPATVANEPNRDKLLSNLRWLVNSLASNQILPLEDSIDLLFGALPAQDWPVDDWLNSHGE